MIEKIILVYLKGEGFHASMEMPENRPAYPFVIIEKTGSSRSNRITTSTLAIQSYGATLDDAMELNERVKEVMDEAISLPDVTKVTLNSDYNFTDTSTKRYRYQAVFDITHY